MMRSYWFLKYSLSVLWVLIFSFGFSTQASAFHWPTDDWEIAQDSASRLSTPQCREFTNFTINSNKFLTEGLVVVKDGSIQYEYYDSKYNRDRPHILWSVSKTITGALLGIAVRDGKLKLDQKLSEFYSPSSSPNDSFENIRIKNLFYLDTGFVWDEYYAGNVNRSPVLNMLYGSGHRDVAKYAAERPTIAAGPGYQWNYTTGTPMITLGVLRKVYGQDYEQMPWKALFDPLGMKSVTFERDSSGTFVGGSWAFATPRDMAKLGFLYLNRGIWDGKTILPSDWIDKTLTPSPGYLSEGTKIRDITDEGVYGGSIWLNRAIKSGFGRPYPFSPEDMFLAMGHYGQLLIMLPSQNMIIARTGYDHEYNSKIDEFVSRAISCFADSNYRVGKNIPPPQYSKVGLSAELETLETGIRGDILQAAVAKTVCSCHLISGIDLQTCISRSNIPAAAWMSRVRVRESAEKTEVSAHLSWLAKTLGFHWGRAKKASFDHRHPEFGCTLE